MYNDTVILHEHKLKPNAWFYEEKLYHTHIHTHKLIVLSFGGRTYIHICVEREGDRYI